MCGNSADKMRKFFSVFVQDRTQNRKRKENSMSELKIGNVTLENNLILAPMQA